LKATAIAEILKFKDAATAQIAAKKIEIEEKIEASKTKFDTKVTSL